MVKNGLYHCASILISRTSQVGVLDWYIVYELAVPFASQDEDVTDNIIQVALLFAGDPNGTVPLVAFNTRNKKCWSKGDVYTADNSMGNLVFFGLGLVLCAALPGIVLCFLYWTELRPWHVLLFVLALVGCWMVFWAVVGIVVSTNNTILYVSCLVGLFSLIWTICTMRKKFNKMNIIITLPESLVICAGTIFILGSGLLLPIALNQVLPAVRGSQADFKMFIAYAILVGGSMAQALGPAKYLRSVLEKISKKREVVERRQPYQEI